MPRLIDLTGRKFGRLIVIRRVGNDKSRQPYWFCECDCNETKIIRGSDLRNNCTKSCGCLKLETVTKHGYNKIGKVSRTYRLWQNMKDRCSNLNNKSYKNYGGRGIKVCPHWMKFKNFLKDMGEVQEGHQIDRVDNDKGYDKGNCRFVTSKQNNRNRRDNHLETHDGKTQCISAWAEETGISYDIIKNRLRRDWSFSKALTTPIKKWRKHE